MFAKRNGALLFIGTIALLGVSGCARYSAQPLNRLTTIDPQVDSDKKNKSNKTEKTISMSHHVFDKWDCKKHLDRDVLAKGYQPVQVTVTNNSDRYISLCKANISLPTVPAAMVAKKVHTSTMTRAACYGAAGLILWPFFIPAIVDGIKSSEANHQLDEDFSKKELTDQVIAPYNTVSGLIFVRKEDFRPEFTITAVDVEKRARFVLNSHKPYTNI